MAMIERAFAATGGRGLFVMGSDDGTQAGDPAWEGLRRSRRQCCATPMPTAVVTFRYADVPVRTAAASKPQSPRSSRPLATSA